VAGEHADKPKMQREFGRSPVVAQVLVNKTTLGCDRFSNLDSTIREEAEMEAEALFETS
jgi:hypothetical protein